MKRKMASEKREMLEHLSKLVIVNHIINSEKVPDIKKVTRDFDAGVMIASLNEESITYWLGHYSEKLELSGVYRESSGEYREFLKGSYQVAIYMRNKDGFRLKSGFSAISVLFFKEGVFEYGSLVLIDNKKTMDFTAHSYYVIDGHDGSFYCYVQHGEENDFQSIFMLFHCTITSLPRVINTEHDKIRLRTQQPLRQEAFFDHDVLSNA